MIDPSKDKFAYFKDNIQTAEDKEFDASQYYYHREDMTGKSAGSAATGIGGSGGMGAGALNLSGSFHGMGGGVGGALGGMDGDVASAQAGFAAFHAGGGSGMMGGGSSAGSFLGGSATRGSLTGTSGGLHELQRMNSADHLTAVMKGRSFQLQSEKAPDMSEFPALGARSTSWSLDPSGDASARSQSSEFVIQKEDFPALSPFGTSSAPNSNDKASMQAEHQLHELKRQPSFTSSASDSMASQRPSGPGGNTSIGSRASGPGYSLNSHSQAASGPSAASTSGSNVSLSGTGAFGPLHGSRGASATNGQLDPNNQFGLLGMLHTVIRPSNDAKKNLMMGCDLTSLGLNLNSAEPLHPVVASPWAEGPLTKEPQFTLPMCYYNQPPVLKTTHLAKFHLETLFYIFYSMPRDVLQAYAAQELYGRDWRYHSDLKMWLKRASAADAALFANGASGAPPVPSTGGLIGAGNIGSIGSAPSTGASTASAASLGALGPQFLYFDTAVWERRVFLGNIHSISSGLMSEEEIRVKFSASS